MNVYPVKSSKAGVHCCEQFDGASIQKLKESLSPTYLPAGRQLAKKKIFSHCKA